jgi:hypothetical protein
VSILSDLARLEFGDRPSYLAWRAAWRIEYRRLSGEIRQHKRLMKPCRENDFALDHSRDQSLRELKRGRARAMLEVRAESKAKATAAREAVRRPVAA